MTSKSKSCNIDERKLLDYPQIQYPSPADILDNKPVHIGCNEDYYLHSGCEPCPFYSVHKTCLLSDSNRLQLNAALRRLLRSNPELFI